MYQVFDIFTFDLCTMPVVIINTSLMYILPEVKIIYHLSVYTFVVFPGKSSTYTYDIYTEFFGGIFC